MLLLLNRGCERQGIVGEMLFQKNHSILFKAKRLDNLEFEKKKKISLKDKGI